MGTPSPARGAGSVRRAPGGDFIRRPSSLERSGAGGDVVNGASTGTALAAVAAWLALATVGGLSARGVAVPLPAAAACSLLAGPVALAGLIEAVTSFWRGPAIVPFARDEAVSCTTAEATFVRAAARLRGTMGGAGHLTPAASPSRPFAWAAPPIVGRRGARRARSPVRAGPGRCS